MSDKVENITVQNVGSLNTYQIRQELNRRDAMDIPETEINHKSLLRRLIVELMKDENEKSENRASEVSAQRNLEREEALKLRELRKKEAMERSAKRQADKSYFADKVEKNVKPEPISGIGGGDSNAATADVSEEEEVGEDVDPFRLPSSSRRNKISLV